MKSLVFTLAAALRKKGLSFKHALRNAWLIIKGGFVVTVTFEKENGDTRTATALLKNTKVTKDKNRTVGFVENGTGIFKSFRFDRLTNIEF